MSTSIRRARRQFTFGLAGAVAAAPYLARRAFAQDYPSGPVQIAVAYGAGGGTDTFARLLAPSLAKALGKPVTVQNLPGGGGQVAATTMLRDGSEGLTILATNEPDLSISTVFAKPPYKITDFQVIMVDVVDPRVLLVQNSSPLGSFADFVARAKAEPNKVAVAVTQGGAQELFGKWLFGRLGLQVRMVGYNGGAAAANALLAGDVVAAIGDDSARMNIRDKSKCLLVGAAKKSPRWPEAITLTEALAPHGIKPPTPDFLTRYGVYVVPSGFKTKHRDAYTKLQKALQQSRNAPEFQSYIAANGLQDLSIGKPGEDYTAAFAGDLAAILSLKS